MPEQVHSRPLPKTIDRPTKREAAIFRKMPVTRPVEMVFEMWDLAWGLVESSVKADHPDWAPERVRSEVKERMRYDAA